MAALGVWLALGLVRLKGGLEELVGKLVFGLQLLLENSVPRLGSCELFVHPVHSALKHHELSQVIFFLKVLQLRLADVP